MTSAAPLWVALHGRSAPPGQLGGKGAWLDRLVHEGFRVPPTAVVTTEAYDAVASGPELAPLLAELASRPPPPPEEQAAARQRVDEAFLGAAVPPAVTRAMVEAAAAARDGRSDALLAARSSATAEDLHGTSFAGQYRSELGLEDDAAVERAVRLVWSSLWHPAPRAYRRFHGIDQSSLGMAVVLMRQVPAERAGVAFTVDPAGHGDAVRVETVTGLGEQLVSGAVTPRVALVARRPEDRPEGFDPLAGEVADVALRVAEALGGPQDVEWAWDGDRLWLLQARPITTVDRRRDDGFDTPGAEGRRWTSAGIAEMAPGVLPPLRWCVLRLLLEQALRGHDERLGALPDDLDGGDALVGRVRGRAVLDADRLGALTAAVHPEHAGRLTRWRLGRRAARARRLALWEGGTVGVAAREVIDLAPDLAPLDDVALLAHRRRLIDLGMRAMAAEVGVAAAAVTAVDRFTSGVARHLADRAEAERWVARTTGRPGGTVAGWPAAELESAVADADPAAVAAMASADGWPDAVERLGEAPGGLALLASLRSTLRRTGSAAVFSGPTWEELPDLLWPGLQAVARAADASGAASDVASPAEGSTPLEDLLDGLAANPDWRRTRLLTAQVVDLRRALLRRQAEDAGDLLERRERVKGAVLAIGGEVRRAELELGRRLVEAGVLARADDVELLDERELAGALTGPGAPGTPPPAELATRRRWLTRWAADAAGPDPTGGAGQVRAPGPHPEATHRGWGAAPGRARGTARVLHSPDEGGLRPGDVLVAPTTDASWAPLFMTAAAVVVEEGGPLSHAAIIARELGIPAVVNLPGIVAALATPNGDGPMVTVDGDDGVVQVDGATAALRPEPGDAGAPAADAERAVP